MFSRHAARKLLAPLPCLLALAVTLSLAVFAPKRAFAATSAPELTEAQAAIITDQAGNVLWELNADEQLVPASITKIMSAMVALDAGIPLGTVCSIQEYDLGVDSQSVGYTSADTPTLEELLLAMLVYSGNDAAANIAYNVSGSTSAFVQLMNQKALELGMTHTHFANPHGLEEDGHYTTARDLVIMGRYAMEHYPFIAAAVRNDSVEVTVGGSSFYLPSTDELMPVYECLLGIKTGAVAAGTTFLGASQQGDVALYSCVLGCATDWGRFEDTRILMDWAYESFDDHVVVGKDWTVRLAPYALCFSQKCRIGVTDDATASLWPSQPSPTSSTAYASYGLPVDVGDVVGVVYQRQDGRLAGGNGIVALEPAAIPSVNPFALSLFEGAAS